jgi:hypothetical protein
MKLSYISDERVTESKGGNLGEVDGIITLDSFAELTDACLKYHVAVSLFHDGRRHGDNFSGSYFLGFDFDDGSRSHDVHSECIRRNWSHIIMGSKNHLKDKGDGRGPLERFHLFLQYRSESKEDYKYAAKKIASITGWSSDRACTDATRYFYRHSQTLFVWTIGSEIRRDYIQRFRNIEREAEDKRISERSFTDGNAIEGFKKTGAYRRLTENLSGDGNRYADSSHIIGVMIKCGLSEDECLALFDQHAVYGRSFTRETICRRFRQWS